jgi:short-subunit dehydrogenase
VSDLPRNAFITGASSGIGAALAREFGRRGWRVTLFARRGDLLQALVSELRAGGVEAFAEEGDVLDADAVRAAVDRTVARWGIDMAIANAGVSITMRAVAFNLENARQILNVNVVGTLHLFDAVLPHMLARKSGHFVGVASIAGLRGLPGSAMYSASKAAVQAFLEGVRGELALAGIRVTTVNPGYIKTPMTDRNRFHMPFLMSAEDAAVVIADGLEAGKREIEFPRPLSLFMRAVRLLPNALYDRATMPYARRKMK